MVVKVTTTSVTGRLISSRKSTESRGVMECGATRGFSLLELMVVILIIGLIYGVATVSLSTVGSDPLEEEVKRLRYSMQVGQTEAIIRSQPIAIGFTAKGYSFYKLEEKTWEALETERLLAAYTLPNDMDAELFLDNISVVLPEESPEKPQVYLLPTGESSPFMYQIDKGGERQRIRFNALGQIMPEEDDNG